MGETHKSFNPLFLKGFKIFSTNSCDYWVTHQKSFLDFNYQENNCIAIANQGAIQINFCKYCFSLPPPSEKI
jgi:hypothetical protein